MFFGNSNGNGNQGGLGAGGGGGGYFHPHAKFQVNAAVRVVERGDSGVETVSVSSPTIFSASVTVGNVVVNNECGSVELLTMKTKKKKRHSGSIIYDYDYDASDSSDLGVFYSPPSPCIPPTTPSPSTSTSSSSSSSIIPHSSLCISPRNVYNNNNNNNTSTATSSPSPAAGSSNKKRLKNRQNRVEGGGEGGGGGCDRNKWTKLLTPGGLDSYSTSPGFELEGCLGGF